MRYRYYVMSPEETISHIKKMHCSVARYGDGEFGLITQTNHPDFQKYDPLLANRLTEICKVQNPKILICIPHNFKNTRDCNEFARKFWEWWCWESNNLKRVAELLELTPWKTRIFGDAQITRPYMDWSEKGKSQARFDALKELWLDRDILIVEGEHTRLGVGNDLLCRARSIRRILCPSQNAFSVYEQIFSATLAEGKNKLVLLALGPTATVLAHDLALKSIQAIDIGHIDIEYEWFLRGARQKIAIEGKDTQEAHSSLDNASFENQEYLSQIILKIEC